MHERVGEIFCNKKGEKAIIVKYNSAKDILVQFYDDYSFINTSYYNLKNKAFNKNKKTRVGEINFNSDGLIMEIVSYPRVDNIFVKFDDGTIANAEYADFLKGSIKNHNFRRLCGIGYHGKHGLIKDDFSRKAHNVWRFMIRRCYDPLIMYHHTAYRDCTVCSSWHSFYNFFEWFKENYYEIPNEKMQLDKDLILRGNTRYSPACCSFVPQCINVQSTNSKKMRGNLPLGVSINNRTKLFKSQIKKDGKVLFIGDFDNTEDAFYAYKDIKEKYLKELAERYKEYIPEKVYNSLINWEIKITD